MAAKKILKKRIIMIHGLASKPPKKDVHALWSQCLVENLAIVDPVLAKSLAGSKSVLRHAYWANATPHHLEDTSDYVEALEGRVAQVIVDRRASGEGFHVGKGAKIAAFFKDKTEDLVKILAGALMVKEGVMKAFMAETKLYDEDQYIADEMRRPLEKELRSAWDDGCDVALLSHSMGSFIAYDVLWRFAHRSTKGFAEYNDKRVQLFTTMGSPLGDNTIRSMLFAKHHKKDSERQFPTNIDFWHNYSCLGDAVSHPSNLESSYFKPMRKLGLFPSGTRAIDYDHLHNPFQVVGHSGNRGREKRNPHKSYGYLVQPRLATWIQDFLKSDLTY